MRNISSTPNTLFIFKKRRDKNQLSSILYFSCELPLFKRVLLHPRASLTNCTCVHCDVFLSNFQEFAQTEIMSQPWQKSSLSSLSVSKHLLCRPAFCSFFDYINSSENWSQCSSCRSKKINQYTRFFGCTKFLPTNNNIWVSLQCFLQTCHTCLSFESQKKSFLLKKFSFCSFGHAHISIFSFSSTTTGETEQKQQFQTKMFSQTYPFLLSPL